MTVAEKSVKLQIVRLINFIIPSGTLQGKRDIEQ
jgi:hypothetical protein